MLLGLEAKMKRAAWEESQAGLSEARRDLERLAETNRVTSAELERLRAESAALKEQVEESDRARTSMEQQFRADLESKDVTISELQGRLTVDILDRVLFDSGESRLKPEGAAVLFKVASLLARYPDRQVQVAGHTDNVPIRNRTAEGYTDNWALSAGRATAAVRHLVEKEGVDPRRVAAVGFGEFRPIADNATPEGRARNRRIAVVVLPQEVAPVDRPASSTPAQPASSKPGNVVPDASRPE